MENNVIDTEAFVEDAEESEEEFEADEEIAEVTHVRDVADSSGSATWSRRSRHVKQYAKQFRSWCTLQKGPVEKLSTSYCKWFGNGKERAKQM